MFAVSLSVCKHSVPRRTFRLIFNSVAGCSNAASPKGFLELNSLNKRFKPDLSRPGISFTTGYINRINNPQEMQWDDLTQQLRDMNVENPSTKIFQACIRLARLDVGTSYYNYLTAKGIRLSAIDLIFFSKLLLIKKDEIKNHENLIINFYKDIKDIIESSALVRSYIMEVFAEIPSCFSDLIKNRYHSERKGNMPLILKALQMNMLDVALDFARDEDFATNTNFIDSYVNFCIKKVEEGKFSKDYITKLTEICAERVVPLNHVNLLQPFDNLVKALNKHQDNYHWSIHECKLNEKNVCSHCGLTLVPKSITNEKFSELRDYFLKQAFIDNNIFLNSTKQELKNFLQFLNNTKPYDMVIDGLNFLYKHKNFGVQLSNHYLKYFLDKGFRVLTIGREHSKTTLTKGNFLNKNKYKKNVQFFFTANMSDDDLFLLYATLHGGLNTFFVTGDFLGTYASRLESSMKSEFLKWQISHQYLVANSELEVVGILHGLGKYSEGSFSYYKKNLFCGKLPLVLRKRLMKCLNPPLPHCGLPQLTTSTKKSTVWHLSQQNAQKLNINIGSPIHWYCLKEEKKT